MEITPYPPINDLLNEFLSKAQNILDRKLVGVYLYGSLVWGDFDYDISDIDLLVAVSSSLDHQEFSPLQQMHHHLPETYTQWEDRIEAAYVSLHALQTFKTQRSEIAITSPGEPFHTKEAGKDWLINWWAVREKSVPLFGPDPTTLIAPISKEEFLKAVRAQAQAWGEYIIHAKHSRPYQGYAILTMCRALYTYRNGEQVSKKQAAEWAEQQLPEWEPLIQRALAWRKAYREEVADPGATFAETRRFVQFIINQITTS
jgi:predicted nucleotidyltransferase